MTEQVNVAYVFPGQGSQWVGMGRDLYENFDSARAVFDQADQALGFHLSRLCFEGPDDELRQTINAQPALATVSFACLRAACDVTEGNGLPPPAFVAGHSLGEYTALAAVGVLDFAITVYLTRERGRLMYEAGLRKPGGMVAIIGLDEASLAEVCQETDAQIANVNCPGQLVISGAKENLAKATALAEVRGAPRTIPFQWQRSVEYMVNESVSTFIEIGPGKVLSGLIRRINKNVKTLNIGDAKAIKDMAC
ncbi:Malonyl CoA-acyl carrier protein transacylase [subsurface metagenome]